MSAELLNQLTSREATTRGRAARVIAAANDPHNLPGLARLLLHADEYVRVATGNALTGMAKADLTAFVAVLESASGEQVADGLLTLFRKVAGVSAFLEAAGTTRVIKTLLAMLEHEKTIRRKDAADALAALGWKAETPDDRARYAVAKGDWHIAVKEGAAAVAPLIVAFRSTDANREGVLSSLWSIPAGWDPAALGPVLRLATDREVSTAAERGRIKGAFPDTLPDTLEALFSDPDPKFRAKVVVLLVLLLRLKRYSRVASILFQALRDDAAIVWKPAGAALTGQGALDEFGTLSEGPGFVRIALRLQSYSTQFSTDHIGELIAALAEPEPEIRVTAAHALGKLKAAKAVGPLIARLGDPREWFTVPWAAADALGMIGSRDAVPPLIAALQSRCKHLAQRAARALDQIGDPQAIQPLSRSLGNAEHEVREAAARSLGVFGLPEAIAPLIAALDDPHGSVNRAARDALTKILELSAARILKLNLLALSQLPHHERTEFDDRSEDEAAAWGGGGRIVGVNVEKLKELALREIARRKSTADLPRPTLMETPDRIQLQCTCGATYKVRTEYRGRKTKCPKCGKHLVVP